MADPLRWLLVGGGDIARKRVGPALAKLDGSELVGVCDVAAGRASALATELGAPEHYADLDEALARTSASAVYLATPVNLHARQAQSVLISGRHVLVEKPLGISAADARVAVEASKARPDLRAGCAYFRRFSPRYEYLQHTLQSARLGQIVLVRMAYWSWFNPDPADPKYWRVVKSKGGGGPLADMATHMFDVLIGLIGMPVSVFADVATLVHSYEAEDSSAMLMRMPNGAQVTGSFHWSSKTWSHEFEVVGTEGRVKWHPYDAGKVIETIGRDTRELDLPMHENVHVPLIEDFVRAVCERRSPCVTLEEAAKTNLVLDAVFASATQGREVKL